MRLSAAAEMTVTMMAFAVSSIIDDDIFSIGGTSVCRAAATSLSSICREVIARPMKKALIYSSKIPSTRAREQGGMEDIVGVVIYGRKNSTMNPQAVWYIR